MTDRIPLNSLIQPHISTLTLYQTGNPLEELVRGIGLTDAIKLASNENPLGSSPLVLAAIQENLHTLYRYPDSHACYLKEDLSRHMGPPSQLILGNGSDEVLYLNGGAYWQGLDLPGIGAFRFELHKLPGQFYS